MYQELERAEPVYPWMDDAACQNDPDPDLWFRGAEIPKAADRATALGICAVCKVRKPCLDFAMKEELTDGIYGGLLPEQRRKLTHIMKRN
jgi:WhiB family redox-sensing transcriptional regulator